MSWRIVSVSSPSKLDYKMGYLVVRSRDTATRIHLSEISVLILESTAISLTAYLLRELDRQKIDIVFCDETRTPYGILSSLNGSHDTALRYHMQASWTDGAKAGVWAEIVKQKIRGQIAVLPPEREKERSMLKSYLLQVLPGDVTNREGHAAKVYFNALFGMDYSRDKECAVNAALNYGYSLLLSLQAREITTSGYCTQLGIFHSNRFNRLNLASDLMEPFRPFVDALVRDLKPEIFEQDQKRAMISVLNRQLLIGEKRHFLTTAVRIYTRSILNALDAGEADLIVFPVYDEL